MEIVNKKARLNYEIIEEFEAGIVLNGAEVKAARTGKINLEHSYAKFISGELYLVNAHFGIDEGSPTAKRKLLLHKKQLLKISHRLGSESLTLVPLKLYNKGRLIKLLLALSRGRKKHQKREFIKKREVNREVERALKDY